MASILPAGWLQFMNAGGKRVALGIILLVYAALMKRKLNTKSRELKIFLHV